MPNDSSNHGLPSDPLELYKALVAASPDAVTMTDLEGRITFVSARTLSLHGYERASDLLGRSAFDLIATEDHAAAMDNLKRTMEEGQAKGLEYTLICKDGQRFPAELNTALVRDSGGAPRAFVAFTRDITERKKVEDVLQQSEKRYRTLLESVTDYTYSVKVENGRPGRTVHGANCAAVTGYSQEEFTGNPLLWLAMVHDEDKKAVAEHADATLQGKACPIEHRIMHKNGSVRWVRNTTLPRFGSSGDVVSLDGTVTDITERKLNEELIKESREHYRLLVDLSPDGIMVHSQGRVVFINEKGARILGAKEHDELVGKRVIDLVHPEFRDQAQERIEEMYYLQVPYPAIEQRLVKLDGEEIDVELTPAGFIQQGESAVLTVFRDITERKRVDNALRVSEEMNRAITQESPLGISVRNRKGRLISYNRAWQKIWAMSEDEVRKDLETERAELKLDHRDRYLGEWSGRVERVYRDGGVLSIPELRISKPSFGGERWISQHFYALKDQAGEVERVVILTEDITERKLAEEKLRKSETRNKALLEAIPDMMFVANRDGLLLDFRVEREEHLAVPVGDVVGTNIRAIGLSAEHLNSALEKINLACDSGSVQRTEYDLMTPAGFRQFEARMSALDENEVLIIVRDITERKQAENVLRRDRETFQRMVEERTADLLKARDELERAERLSELGRLSVTVAHELRNPLGVMRIAAFNMGRKGPAPALRRHLRNIEQKIAESERIINNLLGFARIQSPKLEQTDLVKLIEECASETKKRWPRVKLKRSLAPIDGVAVTADRLQVKEALQNVLENAAQAVPYRGGIVEVAAETLGKGVEIRIANNGQAIRSEDLPNIFKPFFTTRARGIGLGLTIAKELVELHRGVIAVSSRGEKGAEFVIWIPFNLGGED